MQQVIVRQKGLRAFDERLCVDDVLCEQIQQLQELVVCPVRLQSFLCAVEEKKLFLCAKCI